MEDLSYLQQLIEGRGYRDLRYITRLSLRDVLNRMYLAFLGLQILNQDHKIAHEAQQYAKNTLLRLTDFNSSKTDLGGLICLVHFHPEDIKGISDADHKESTLLLHRMDFTLVYVKKYLQRLSAGHLDIAADRRFFLQLEKDLVIDNPSLRSMRRLGVDWSHRFTDDRQLVITRWLQLSRKWFPRFDLKIYIEHIAKRDKLELEASELAKLRENASAGSTSAGAIASVPGGASPMISRTMKKKEDDEGGYFSASYLKEFDNGYNDEDVELFSVNKLKDDPFKKKPIKKHDSYFNMIQEFLKN